jgi:CBS domain containing-hemolysin-like protein
MADEPLGVVHVRDALTAPAGTTAAQLMRPLLTLPGDTPMHAALTTIRDKRNHVVLVYAEGEPAGFVTLHDLLQQLLPNPR